MNKNITNISGVTLIEILMGVVISIVMMAAMFTSYNVVNNTYSKVTDTAKMSQAGREVLGMIMRDVRMAGYKYFGDNIPYDAKEHIPIKITKQDLNNPCDKIEIVYGDIESNPLKFKRYRVTYECVEDTSNLGLKILQKKKEVWVGTLPGAFQLDGTSDTYDSEDVVQYVQDLIFYPIDNKGQIIHPPPSDINNTDKVNSIKLVEVLLSVRSKNKFFRSKKKRIKEVLMDGGRKIGNTEDRYLRETILITAHARNVGL